MREHLHIRVHRRRRGGCGLLLLYWLALTIVYMLTGIIGVWIVLGIGVLMVLLAAASKGANRAG